MQFLQWAFRCALTVFGVLTYSTLAYCRPVSIPDLARLTSSSAAIVVGEVFRVVRVGSGEIRTPDGKTYACPRMAASVRVDEVLKGELTNGPIQVEYLQNLDWNAGPLTNELTEGRYLLFFLNPDGVKYAFATADQSSLPMSRSRSRLSDSSNGDVYTHVLWHVAEPLFDQQDSSMDSSRAIFVIGHEGSPEVTKIFKEALDGSLARSYPDLRFSLLAALVGRKELSSVPELETALFANHDAALNNSRIRMLGALQQIDPSISTPILIRALKLPQAPLRAAAAAALASASSDDAQASAATLDEAVVALLHTLDDPDDQVKGMAINSLTSIFHAPQCLPPGYVGDQFASCVAQWKGGGAGYYPSRIR
jgi:hypothetical protein